VEVQAGRIVDSGGGDDVMPTIELPRWNLRAQYWIPASEIGDGGVARVFAVHLHRSVWLHRDRTDAADAPGDVPPLAFSEVMRDIDLFVGVASAGNDPNWVAAGEPVGDYWHQYSFGDCHHAHPRRYPSADPRAARPQAEDRRPLRDEGTLPRRPRLAAHVQIHVGSTNI
jgi:hypothetical protein